MRPSSLATDHQSASSIDWKTELTQHQRWLWTVVYARVREREGVDEIMQEVALAAIRQASPVRDRTCIGPWLYRLAIRQALLYRRKRGRQRKLNDRLVNQSANGEGESADPLNWLLADERRGMVRRALTQLAQRDAEILLLKYTEDWSYRQIAARLGVSESAVEARLHRARRRMREVLADLNVIEVKPCD